jgi:structural maintenance of chromosome 1
MDVDEEDEESGSSQRLKRVSDYGIEVDFEVLSGEEREVSATSSKKKFDFWKRRPQDSSGETLAEFDASITKLNAEIERMTPNMKAMDRHVPIPSHSSRHARLMTAFFSPQTR